MCHIVVAQRVCQVCHDGQGEIVIGFTHCARPCASPSYRLTPTPQLEFCSPCASRSTTTLSTPVVSRNISIDSNTDEAISVAAAAAAAATAAAASASASAASVVVVAAAAASAAVTTRATATAAAAATTKYNYDCD
ncbi:hypothetical protein BGZ63DRAFT_400623 [Mariannaea sp. PMI_226]|nr:hypothetical protein BGZ63DRAFT_400623 [Mariannaea sp. PMI_226]